MKQSLWALVAAASFSIMAAFVKLCSDQMGAFELVFYRSLFGVLAISIFIIKDKKTIVTPLWKLHVLRSVLGVLSIVLWYWALARMDFGTCMTLIYTTPLFLAANFVVLALMRHQTPPWSLVIPIVTGFIGITTVLQPSLRSDELLPALICLFTSAIDLIVYWQMKKMGETHEPPWRIVFYFTMLSMLFSAVGTFAMEGGFHAVHGMTLLGILGMGACATLGQLASTRSFAYGNMLLSSLLGFSAVPFSLLIGTLLFNDKVSVTALLGVALIVGSGLFATVSTKHAEKKHLAHH